MTVADGLKRQAELQRARRERDAYPCEGENCTQKVHFPVDGLPISLGSRARS